MDVSDAGPLEQVEVLAKAVAAAAPAARELVDALRIVGNIDLIASMSRASSARNSSLTVCSGVLVAGAGCFAPFRNFRQKRRYKQLASGTKEAFTMRP
jgi:hypothetical protein